MTKHDYKEQTAPETGKPSMNLAVGNGSGYDPQRVAAEKNTMRKLEKQREAGKSSRDVVRFNTTTDVVAFREQNRNAHSDARDERTQYVPQSDVEKNIYEAERYINFIATQKSIHAVSEPEQKEKRPLPSTMEITAFSPRIDFESGGRSETAVYIPKAGTSGAASVANGESAPFADGRSGDSPSGGVTGQTKIFSSGGVAVQTDAVTEQTKAYHAAGGVTEQTRAYRAAGGVTEQTRAYRAAGGVTEQTRAYRAAGGVTEQTRAYHAAGDVTEQTRAYHAAGGITEQTRAYRAAKDITKQTSVYWAGGAVTEQTKAFDVGRETERPGFFGEYSEKKSDFSDTSEVAAFNENEKKSKKKQKKQPTSTHFEYTSPMQDRKIAEKMESYYTGAKIRLAISVFLAIALFLIENIAPIKAIFPTRFSYVVTDWVLAFACFFLMLDRLRDAVKSIFKWNPGVDCVTFFAFFISVAATAVAVVFENTESTITLYNFPFAVCVMLDLLFVYYKRKRDLYSFAVLSSYGDKCAIVLDGAKEGDGSAKKIKAGEIKRVEFIDGYFAHCAEMPNVQAPLKLFLPLCFAVSVAFFACSLWIMKHSAAESLGIAYAAFMMCTPFSVFLSYCYPFYLASRRAHSYRSAILCDKTPDVYKDSSVIVFRDTEAIPFGMAKVKSIRLYGDKKIDKVIHYASSVYSVIGGPLEDVFRSAALNGIGSHDVQIREIESEGVCAMVDGKNIVIGRPAYMENQCFETMAEQGDDEYDGKTNKRILYLACEHEIIAKFYIQYSVSTEFLYVANSLFASGLGVSVRTADPCLDDGIFYENQIDPEQRPIHITRACLRDEDEESVPANRAGIVSVGDVKELIKTFLICKKLEQVRRTNLVLHIISAVFAIAVMSLVLFTGNAPGFYSVFPALYQLFWILPTYFVSKVYL